MRKLKEETKVYNNFPGILEKVERDGHLQSIYATTSHILQSEMTFAITRNLKRAEKDADEKHADRHQEAFGDKPLYFQGKPEAHYSFGE